MASTTTNALSVVGSIGGLASAADSIASLLTGDWFSTLKTASFGGVPFGVFEIRIRQARTRPSIPTRFATMSGPKTLARSRAHSR